MSSVESVGRAERIARDGGDQQRARRIGLNVPLAGLPLHRHAAALARIESLGFSDLFSQETDAHDALTPLAVAAAWTARVRLGSAVASIFTRGPALLAMQASSLADAAPGRFVLGLGTSSAPIVEGWNGGTFDRPWSRMRDTLRYLRVVLTQGRAEAEGARLGTTGFRLGPVSGSRAPGTPPIHIAALGPRMLRLAAEEADGVMLSLVGPEHAAALVTRYRAAEPEAGRGEVVLRIGCLLDDDGERARAHARRTLAAYLAVPTYGALYTGLGEGERVVEIASAWRRGAHAEARRLVLDTWVEGVFAIGRAEDIAERIGRFRAAGIDTPIIAPTVFDGDLDAALEVWARA